MGRIFNDNGNIMPDNNNEGGWQGGRLARSGYFDTQEQEREPESAFGKFINFVGDIGKGFVRDVISSGLSLKEGARPSNLFRNPIKKPPEPLSDRVKVFGEDVGSVQRNLFEAGEKLDRGEINKEQFLGTALSESLTPLVFGAPWEIIGKQAVEGVAKQGLKEVVKDIGKSSIKYGLPYGLAGGASEAMKENAPWKEVAKTAGESGLVGMATVAGFGTAGHYTGRLASRFKKIKSKYKKEIPVKKTEKKVNVPKGNIDIMDIIKKDNDLFINKRNKIKIPGTQKEARGGYRYNFKTGKGEMKITPTAKPSTIAHEYAHHLNYKFGNKDKFTNELNRFLEGNGRKPKIIEGYEAKKLLNDIKKASRVGKNVEFRLGNTSEEFATAFGNYIEKQKDIEKSAPLFAKFVKERLLKERLNKPKKIFSGKKIKWAEKEDKDVEKYIRETKGIKKARNELTAKGYQLVDHYNNLQKMWERTTNKNTRKTINKEIAKTQKLIAEEVKKSKQKFRTIKNKDKEEKVTLKTLNRIKEDIKKPVVSKQALLAYANRGDIKQAERDIIRKVLDEMPDGKVSVKEFIDKVKAQLLSLARKDIKEAKYESISLPDDVRGNVANYEEHIYKSPIKTSAGDVHFGDEVDNYFAHTRVEDMAGENSQFKLSNGDIVEPVFDSKRRLNKGQNYSVTAVPVKRTSDGKPMGKFNLNKLEQISQSKTRRVIEVQSDLFQKGNLKQELQKDKFIEREQTYNFKKGFADRKIKEREKEIAPLQPYRNTWHERIIKEEIKRASQDGKTKLQFPTGETAMKIEGLSERNTFQAVEKTKFGEVLRERQLSKEDLRIGKEIADTRGNWRNNKWIITEVLDDGKFKAVPKNIVTDNTNLEIYNNSGNAETFDISGKVDTKNPIYKFYEKDIQKYLKRIHPEMQRVTDENGVTWFEIKPKKEEGIAPVQAFRKTDEEIAGKKLTEKQLEKIKELNKRIFGDENIKITKQILTPEGQKALGVYSDGMIKILDGQADPKDTYYHEVVHKFIDVMTTMDEHKEVLISAKRHFKAKTFEEAEEKLAESFINYAKTREGVTGKLKLIFDKLLRRFKGYSENKEVIDDFYNKILKRKFEGKKNLKPIVPENIPKKFIPKKKDKTKYTAKVNTSDDVRKMVEKLEKSDEVQREIQKRGIVSWKETIKQAEEMGIDISGLRKEAKNAKDFASKLEATKQLRANKMQELHDFLSKIPRNPNEEQKKEIARRIEEFLFIDRSLKSLGAEHGRAINILKHEVIPEEYEMYNKLIDKIVNIDPKKYKDKTSYVKDVDKEINKQDKILNYLGLTRSMMTTADLSAPFRQGVFVSARHPIMFAKSFKSMLKQALSEKEYQKELQRLKNSGLYYKMKKAGLALTELDEEVGKREEAIMSNLVEKIPGFGKIARGSNRAYTGFLNKLRADYFENMTKAIEKAEGSVSEKQAKSMASYINSATGRGDLPKWLKDSSNLLNALFFSPKLIASRVHLLNPHYYYKLDPYVRKEALKDALAFLSMGASILSLAKLNGAEVGTDPRSADFGKIKIGNTRYDIWGGFQQYAVLLSRLLSGEMVSSTTGKEFQLGEGYKATTRGDIIRKFFSYKTAPLASYAMGLLNGKNAIGKDFDVPAETLKRFIPMVISDFYDITKDDKSPLMALPGVFGVGVQTYTPKMPFMVRDKRGRRKIKWEDQGDLAEDVVNYFRVTKKSNIPKSRWKPLYRKKLKEDRKKAELSNAKLEVLKTGKPKRINGKRIFLKNGIVQTSK